MTNRDKTIKGLEHCIECDNGDALCNGCPYEDDCFGENPERSSLLCDALELITEQPKPRAAHWAKMRGMMPPELTGHFECDNCGWHGKSFVREIDFAYCPGCGAKMSIDGLHAEDCKKTPFDKMIDDYLEATGGVINL